MKHILKRARGDERAGNTSTEYRITGTVHGTTGKRAVAGLSRSNRSRAIHIIELRLKTDVALGSDSWKEKAN